MCDYHGCVVLFYQSSVNLNLCDNGDDIILVRVRMMLLFCVIPVITFLATVYLCFDAVHGSRVHILVYILIFISVCL